MTGEDDGNAQDQPASRFLVVRILGHWDTRYSAWAWVGLSNLPRAVHQDLDREALQRVRRLRLVLLDHFTSGARLGWAEIESVAAAVHACGEWWPMPEISARMVRDICGLDVPVAWGLEALRRHLRPEMVEARDHLGDREKTSILLKTLVAAGDLVNELHAAIGGRYANGRAKPSAAKLDLVWRRFDAARAKSGGITLLPLFGSSTTRHAP